ncbi:urea transporter [Corynebacterium sp. zg-331]|uniref:urea transporter n=1 Tax=unclassified Corynebacterium TaxID=2624378 RepID=UPI00128BD6B4|nr:MULTISPECIES: urea transporter [unclassified Corynebacterium]MBC3186730.1 urea transporter [Corynebacterium sp. zg-331]MPV53212.1 hypothetical protein [Corynebacterium sp. zg331]
MRSLCASLAQIYLVPSWRVGLLIAVALAWVSPALACGALSGAAASAAGGVFLRRLLGRPAALVGRHAREGLLGYNGALVGALVAARCGAGAAAAAWGLLGVCGAVALHLLLERPLGRVPGGGLPVLTAPLCAVGTALDWWLPQPPAPSAPDALLSAIPAAFAQTSLGAGVLPGALILAALTLAAPRAAAWGVIAAAMTLPVALAVPAAEVAAGAWSYCAVLAGIALGTAPSGTHRGWRHRVIPVMAAVACALLIQAVLARAGWPVLTWPFVIATWMVLAVKGLRHGR